MKYLNLYENFDFEEDFEEEPPNNDYAIYEFYIDEGDNDGWRFYPTHKKEILGRDRLHSTYVNNFNDKHLKELILNSALHGKLKRGDYFLSNGQSLGSSFCIKWTLSELCDKYPQFKKYL